MTNAHQVLIYRDTRNLGDAVQTAAISRLLPNSVGVYRDVLPQRPRTMPLVLNGYLWEQPPTDDADTLFAGVYVEPTRHRSAYADWMKASRYAAVGVRDPATLQRYGGELIGCATLTLPRYNGVRSGRYVVDYVGRLSGAKMPLTPLTHTLPLGRKWDDDWKRATDYLDLYRKAEVVYTSRLHVALPCLAFGTPVVFTRNPRHAHLERLSIYSEGLGLPFGDVVAFDVSRWADDYRRFLETHLNVKTADGEATKPHSM